MRLVTLIRVGAALVVLAVAVIAGGALERRGATPTRRGPAGPSSGDQSLGAGDAEIRAAREAPPPAGDSLFAVPGTFHDAGGRPRTLGEFRGAPSLVSLVYTRCPTVCPRVVAELERLERLPGFDPRTRILLVSLDPGHDTPDVLRAFAEAHALDAGRWTLLSPEPAALAALARSLGVASGPEADGGIAHSAIIAVVDTEGRVRRRHVGLAPAAEALAAELRALR
jgi:protein SCO1/2